MEDVQCETIKLGGLDLASAPPSQSGAPFQARAFMNPLSVSAVLKVAKSEILS